MNRLLLVLGVLATSALLVPDDAEAQRYGGRGGGGGARIGAGGYGGSVRGSRMIRPPVRGVSSGRVAGVRTAGYYGGRYGVRSGYGRYGVRTAGYYGGRYPYNRGYYGGRYPYYGGYYGGSGWGTAGLVTGSVIGAAAASSYPVYQTPASSAVGGYCATAVRTCGLTNSAPVGTGCSCRTQGGRARGTVVGN
jgi:hypothetical protein